MNIHSADGYRNKYSYDPSNVFVGDDLAQILKLQRVMDIKTVSRSCTNRYYSDKDGGMVDRRETNGEHITGCLKLADFFLETYEEFVPLQSLKAEIFSTLLYHDDSEIVVQDTNIADEELRRQKEQEEIDAVPVLAAQYPTFVGDQLKKYDAIFRNSDDLIAQFCRAIDKLEPLVHELKYPEDWGASKRFGKADIVRRQGPFVSYSPTFTTYLNTLIKYMDDQGSYFDKNE